LGSDNIDGNPLLASASHLSTNSPCIFAGSTNYANGTDFDGEYWMTPPAMGCDEMVLGAALGMLQVKAMANHTNVTTGYAVQFSSDITGQTTASRWIWDDGTTTSNHPFASHAFASAGTYMVELTVFNDSNPLGESDTITVHVSEPVIHYVDSSNTSPLAPTPRGQRRRPTFRMLSMPQRNSAHMCW
jgi:PKD repeat protein